MENYHLVNDNGEWKLKKEGAERASLTFGEADKTTAVQKSADWLDNSGSSLKIHKLDGKIQEERTYPRSADPKKTKG